MDQNVADQIDSFFAQFPMRQYKKRQILIYAGDDPPGIYHLISGRVKQYDLSYRGDEVVLNVFKPPAFFPMSHAVNQIPNNYNFEAEEDCEIHLAPMKEVAQFVRSHPDVMFDLLRRVYRGTDGILGRMAHLMASTAKSRVVYELIIECRRFGKGKLTEIPIDLHESDLGARAGLSRETVNREVRRLKEDGLIRVRQHQIVIPNLTKLESALGRDL